MLTLFIMYSIYKNNKLYPTSQNALKYHGARERFFYLFENKNNTMLNSRQDWLQVQRVF